MPDPSTRSMNPFHLRIVLLALAVCLGLAPAAVPSAVAADATRDAARPTPPFHILKVLPHFLDRDGKHSVNPSLFDRDAYQFELRQNPALRSGLRFDVLWKTAPGTPAALTVKLELRGSKAPEQAPVIVTSRGFSRGGFSQWTRIPIRGKDYEALGELLAWRVTLWKDDLQVAEQTSFLW